MLLYIAEIIFGLVILVWSADRFVDCAADLASRYGMSKLMIGLTIVSFGTSAPEIMVSAIASFSGSGILAVGNALGSNIANTGLILGLTTLIAPPYLNTRLCKRELPLLMVITLAAGIFLNDLTFTRMDGLLLMSGQVAFIIMLIQLNKKMNSMAKEWNLSESDDTPNNTETNGTINENTDSNNSREPVTKIWGWFIFSLILLLGSSKILVMGATGLASMLGVSEALIGVTIVALGTSLPELAATLASIKKNHHDIAVGNIIGSNIMNLTLVLALAGIIAPISVEPTIALRDYGITLILTISLFLFALLSFKKKQFSRAHGSFWISVYLGYLGYLAIQQYTLVAQ